MLRQSFSAMLLTVVAGIAAAQKTELPTPSPLSLRFALDHAKAYDARYQAAQASFRADREIVEQSRALLLPELTVSANRTRNQLDADFGGQSHQSLDYYSGGASINLRQPIYRPENWARYQQAKLELTRLEAVLVTDRNKLMVDVATAYLEVLRSLAEFRSAQAQHASQQGQAVAAARGVPLGLVSAAERDEREARAGLASLKALQLKAKLIEARLQLEKMVGQPVIQLLAPHAVGRTAENLAVDDLALWLDKAVLGSREIAAARAAVEVAQEGIERAEAGHKPTLDLVAGRSKSTSESFSSINNTYYNTSVGVQLSIPLYAGGRVSSAVRQAVAQKEKAQAQLDQALRETKLLVEREHLTVRQAVQRLNVHEALMRSALQGLTAARQGRERGNRSQLDVLEAQGQLETAQFEQAAAGLELLTARVRLQSLAGEVDDATVVQLDQLLVQPVVIER
jgi:protease secretion system outer membrane protein